MIDATNHHQRSDNGCCYVPVGAGKAVVDIGAHARHASAAHVHAIHGERDCEKICEDANIYL